MIHWLELDWLGHLLVVIFKATNQSARSIKGIMSIVGSKPLVVDL
jgi:hypothetical protein